MRNAFAECSYGELPSAMRADTTSMSRVSTKRKNLFKSANENNAKYFVYIRRNICTRPLMCRLSEKAPLRVGTQEKQQANLQDLVDPLVNAGLQLIEEGVVVEPVVEVLDGNAAALLLTRGHHFRDVRVGREVHFGDLDRLLLLQKAEFELVEFLLDCGSHLVAGRRAARHSGRSGAHIGFEIGGEHLTHERMEARVGRPLLELRYLHLRRNSLLFDTLHLLREDETMRSLWKM